MRNESLPNDPLRDLWQSQKSEGIRMSTADVRRKAMKFETRVHRRNVREYGAALVVVVFLGFESWRVPDTLTRAGFILMIAGVAYLAWQLHRRGSARSLPAELGSTTSLEFFKKELERQRDLLQSVWRWYLAPLIPGLVVVTVGAARTNSGHRPHFALWLAVFNVFAASALVFIGWLNQSAARKLQNRIDELNASRK